jgi:hypothetical protein
MPQLANMPQLTKSASQKYRMNGCQTKVSKEMLCITTNYKVPADCGVGLLFCRENKSLEFG